MVWVLFAVGGAVCLLNAYLSWVRRPLHRLRGGSDDDFRWVSGVPLFGSLLVLGAWGAQLHHEHGLALDVTCGLLVAVDTGGPHWFLASLARGRGVARDDTH